VPFHHLAICIVVCSEVVAHRLFLYVQVLCDARDAAMRQRMLDATQFFKRDVIGLLFFNNSSNEILLSRRKRDGCGERTVSDDHRNNH